MTEQQLQSLLNSLNAKKHGENIFLTPLAKLVDYGKYWDKIPKPDMNIYSGDGPYSIYFIKNKANKYIAAVLDMNQNLHWYVSSKFRKQGHLTNNMRSTILPHLFIDRSYQRITIDTYHLSDTQVEESKNVAVNLGFSMIGGIENGIEYQLQKRNFKNKAKITPSYQGLSEERMEQLKKKINYVSRSLWLIHTEINSAYKKDPQSDHMLKLVEEIQKHTWKLEDRYYDNEK